MMTTLMTTNYDDDDIFFDDLDVDDKNDVTVDVKRSLDAGVSAKKCKYWPVLVVVMNGNDQECHDDEDYDNDEFPLQKHQRT